MKSFLINLYPLQGGPIPHNLSGEGSDAPPTLERSGSERRGGAVSSSSLRGEDREERWSLL